MTKKKTVKEVISDAKEGSAKVISIEDGIENQKVVGEVETLNYKNTEPAEQNKTGFTTMDKALQYDLAIRLKELRDGKDELGEYCIVDRFNSADFVEVFKDGINSYRADAVIAERLFRRDQCTEGKRNMYALSDEAKALTEEFTEYTKSINWDVQTDEELLAIKNKVADYQERLKADDMQPQLTEVSVLVYNNGYTELLVTPLSDITDEQIDNYCLVISQFILTYFLTMRIMFHNRFKMHVAPVKTGDYVDIISIIESL